MAIEMPKSDGLTFDKLKEIMMLQEEADKRLEKPRFYDYESSILPKRHDGGIVSLKDRSKWEWTEKRKEELYKTLTEEKPPRSSIYDYSAYEDYKTKMSTMEWEKLAKEFGVERNDVGFKPGSLEEKLKGKLLEVGEKTATPEDYKQIDGFGLF